MSKEQEKLKIQVGKFEVIIKPEDNYGYFEHDDYGDEMGGGLWFNKAKELEDFDGVMVLPVEVADAINLLGYTCDKSHMCE